MRFAGRYTHKCISVVPGMALSGLLGAGAERRRFLPRLDEGSGTH